MSQQHIVEPLGKWAVVERDQADEKTHSGIHIPDNFRRKALTGHIKKVGGRVKYLVPGRRIYFGLYSASFFSFNVNGQHIFLVKEDDVQLIEDE